MSSKVSGIPAPVAGMAKEIIAELVAEHGWDFVRDVVARLRSKPAPAAGGGALLLFVGLVVATSKRKRRR